MARWTFWNPDVAETLMEKLDGRMYAAGELLATKVRSNLDTIIKHQISRPVYKTGEDKGKWWTARAAGEMLFSTRVKTHPTRKHNVWVMCGQKKAYYALMFEYSTHTDPGSKGYRGRPFFRPAVASSKSEMKAIIEGGA